MRRLYLVCYDIATDAKRQRKVFKTLRGFGDHMQFSVFLCELNLKEKAQLVQALTAIIKKSEDQILVIDLGPATQTSKKRIKYYGIPFTHIERHCIVV